LLIAEARHRVHPALLFVYTVWERVCYVYLNDALECGGHISEVGNAAPDQQGSRPAIWVGCCHIQQCLGVSISLLQDTCFLYSVHAAK